MKPTRPFYLASPDEIMGGKTTDVYFERTRRVLEAHGTDKRVVAEVRAKELPSEYEWALFAGLEETILLLEQVAPESEVRSIREGSCFGAGDVVFSITGRYLDFCIHETAILGFLCQSSGIATAAARCRKAAGKCTLLSFGARRMHPAITPMIDRSAYIGGVDGVSAVLSAELLGIEATGTMPHALILLVGDTVEATEAFRNIIGKKVKCVSLIDTFNDEKFEALRVARALGRELFAVRVDTPGSRRGDLRRILEEIRWELDLRGFTHVKLYVSGGMDEEKIAQLAPVADGFGVGTRLAGAPVIDFSFDIVEIEGKPLAKRGKESGAKKLVRCEKCGMRINVPLSRRAVRCKCGGPMKNQHLVWLRNGTRARTLPTAKQIRNCTLRALSRLP